MNIKNIKVGDIIAFRRRFYKHYALYIGNDQVIHRDNDGLFSKHKSKVKITNIYDVPGIPIIDNESYSNLKKIPTEITLNLALSHLDDEGDYNLFLNNCEHFVTNIKFNIKVSKQIKRIRKIGLFTFLCIVGLIRMNLKK